MFSGRYPTRRRVSSECSATSRPPINARPEVGGKNPVKIRIIVVLPEPFGPSSPMISPFSTLNETWSTARVGPKYLVRSWTSIIRLYFLPRERFSFYESKSVTVNSISYPPFASYGDPMGRVIAAVLIVTTIAGGIFYWNWYTQG